MSGLGFDLKKPIRHTVSPYDGDWSSTNSYTPDRSGLLETTHQWPRTSFPEIAPPTSSAATQANATGYFLGLRTTDSRLIKLSLGQIANPYPHCQTDDHFSLHNNWSNATPQLGVVVDDPSSCTFMFSRSAHKDDYESSTQFALQEMDAWVWYQDGEAGRWLSLRGDNGAADNQILAKYFWNYGAVSDDPTVSTIENENGEQEIKKVDLGYFRYRLPVTEGTGMGAQITIGMKRDGTLGIPDFFDIPSCFNRGDEWLILFYVIVPEIATKQQVFLDYQFSPFAPSTASFVAVSNVTGALEDMFFTVSQDKSELASPNFPIPTLRANSIDKWQTPEGKLDSARGNWPLFWVPQQYQHITYYGKSTDFTADFADSYDLGANTNTEFMTAQWHPYARIPSRGSPSSLLPLSEFSQYIYWDGNNWAYSVSPRVATWEKRLLGVIIQADGGSAMTHVPSNSPLAGGGGGGGAYIELLANAYRKYVYLRLQLKIGTHQPKEVYRYRITIKDEIHGTGRTFAVERGEDGEHGGSGGRLFGMNYLHAEGDALDTRLPYTSQDKGDTNALQWYNGNDDSLKAFDWDSSLAAVIASVPGGDGGQHERDGKVAAAGAGNYWVIGVPTQELPWYFDDYPGWEGNNIIPKPLHYANSTSEGGPGKSPGKGSSSSDYPGSGGGASYMGRGGNAYGVENKWDMGELGGGAGGLDYTGSGEQIVQEGSPGCIILFK